MAYSEDSTRRRRIRAKINHELKIFADSLKPSKNFNEKGKAALQKVCQLIHQDPRFSVDRYLPAGSVEKATSVLVPDFDGVLFLNSKLPPFHQTISDLRELLTSEAVSLSIQPNSIKSTGKTVTAHFTNGIEMDLLPACNFSQNIYEQVSQVDRHIAMATQDHSNWSSSLADIQIKFIKSQQDRDQIHELIRLVKFWFKSLSLDQKVYGGSYLMEIICVAVSHEYGDGLGLLEKLKAVIEHISRIDKLKIRFLISWEGEEWMSWRWTLEQASNSQDGQGYIFDPSNPANNLLNNLTLTSIIKMKTCAKLMLERLERLNSFQDVELLLITNLPGVNVDIIKVHLDKLFEPVELNLREVYPALAIPTAVLIEMDNFIGNVNMLTLPDVAISHSKVTVHNQDLFVNENRKAKKVYQAVLTKLLCLVRLKAKKINDKYEYKNGIPEVEVKADVEKAVKTFLENNFDLNSNSVKFISSHQQASWFWPTSVSNSADAEHSNQDVTLGIPYICNGAVWELKFSMRWGEISGSSSGQATGCVLV